MVPQSRVESDTSFPGCRIKKCCKDFRDRVSNARRLGHHDPDLEVEAATMKLIGNSGHGSLIMDQTKHQILPITT